MINPTDQNSAIAGQTARPLVRVSNLTVEFDTPRGVIRAVRDASFEIAPGETVAIVGESGSGKSVTAMSLARLLPQPPARIVSGRVEFDGADVLKMPQPDLLRLRGGRIGFIFQEPSTSLNPVFTVRSQIAETLRLHRPDIPPKQRDAEIIRWLDLVGITDPAKRLRDYPHQLSGGMQQRVMIAMALAAHPSLLVADEPTTALDVTIQAQVISLLKELQARLGMAILIITHNFGIIKGFAGRTLVMFKGQIVEEGPTDRILSSPRHPYTRALIECIPRLGVKRRRLATIGDFLPAGEPAPAPASAA